MPVLTFTTCLIQNDPTTSSVLRCSSSSSSSSVASWEQLVLDQHVKKCEAVVMERGGSGS